MESEHSRKAAPIYTRSGGQRSAISAALLSAVGHTERSSGQWRGVGDWAGALMHCNGAPQRGRGFTCGGRSWRGGRDRRGVAEGGGSGVIQRCSGTSSRQKQLQTPAGHTARRAAGRLARARSTSEARHAEDHHVTYQTDQALCTRSAQALEPRGDWRRYHMLCLGACKIVAARRCIS